MTKERLVEIFETFASMTWDEAEKYIMGLTKDEASFINMFCESLSDFCKKNMISVD